VDIERINTDSQTKKTEQDKKMEVCCYVLLKWE
jgi:hypothetical protein